MSSIIDWLISASWGLPKWGWALIVLGFVTETALGRSTNPKFRSLGDTLGNLLAGILGVLPAGDKIIAILRKARILPADPSGPSSQAQDPEPSSDKPPQT